MVDVARGIGMLLVFLGHSLYWGSSEFKAIFSFHMPLFFFLSGAMFGRRTYESFVKVCAKSLRKLILPYFVFNGLGLLTIPVRDLPSENCALKVVASILFGHSWLNGPSWFLVSLFSVTLISYRLIHFKVPSTIKLSLVLLFYGVGCFVINYVPAFVYRYANPFQLISLPGALLFFWCGLCLSEELTLFEQKRLNAIFAFLISCLLAPILYLVVCRLPNVSIDYGRMGHPILSPIMAFIAIALALLIARILPFKVKHVLSLIGRNSLYYFLLEFVVGSYVVLLFPDVLQLKFPIYKCDTGVATAIVFALFNLVCVSILIVPVKKAYGAFSGFFWSK